MKEHIDIVSDATKYVAKLQEENEKLKKENKILKEQRSFFEEKLNSIFHSIEEIKNAG